MILAVAEIAAPEIDIGRVDARATKVEPSRLLIVGSKP